MKLFVWNVCGIINDNHNFSVKTLGSQNYIRLHTFTDRSILNYSGWNNIFQSVWCNIDYIKICCCVILPFKYNTKLAKISYLTPIIFIFCNIFVKFIFALLCHTSSWLLLIKTFFLRQLNFISDWDNSFLLLWIVDFYLLHFGLSCLVTHA